MRVRRLLLVELLFATIVPIIVMAIAVPLVYAQDVPSEYQPLGELLLDVGGIAFAVGLLFFVVKLAMPPQAKMWLYDDRPWLVNALVIVISIGAANLGAWLNWEAFEARSVVEYIWKGLYSAGVSTFGYEWLKNLGRKTEPGRAIIRAITGGSSAPGD